jgi:hypothetical protein
VHSPTTGPATDHAPGQPPSARPAPSTGAPGPTPPAPTEKSKDSTAPWPANGPTSASTHPKNSDAKPSQISSTTTTTTGPTPPWATNRPPPACPWPPTDLPPEGLPCQPFTGQGNCPSTA